MAGGGGRLSLINADLLTPASEIAREGPMPGGGIGGGGIDGGGIDGGGIDGGGIDGGSIGGGGIDGGGIDGGGIDGGGIDGGGIDGGGMEYGSVDGPDPDGPDVGLANLATPGGGDVNRGNKDGTGMGSGGSIIGDGIEGGDEVAALASPGDCLGGVPICPAACAVRTDSIPIRSGVPAASSPGGAS